MERIRFVHSKASTPFRLQKCKYWAKWPPCAQPASREPSPATQTNNCWARTTQRSCGTSSSDSASGSSTIWWVQSYVAALVSSETRQTLSFTSSYCSSHLKSNSSKLSMSARSCAPTSTLSCSWTRFSPNRVDSWSEISIASSCGSSHKSSRIARRRTNSWRFQSPKTISVRIWSFWRTLHHGTELSAPCSKACSRNQKMSAINLPPTAVTNSSLLFHLWHRSRTRKIRVESKRDHHLDATKTHAYYQRKSRAFWREAIRIRVTNRPNRNCLWSNRWDIGVPVMITDTKEVKQIVNSLMIRTSRMAL